MNNASALRALRAVAAAVIAVSLGCIGAGCANRSEPPIAAEPPAQANRAAQHSAGTLAAYRKTHPFGQSAGR